MTYPLIQSKYYTPGRSGHKPTIIVIHTMETPETQGRAHQVAQWFAGSTAPQSSAHYMVDDKEVYLTVPEANTAWAVGDFGINLMSISIEHAGQAAQTPQQWADAYSNGELHVSAKLVSEIAKRWNIPLVKLTPQDILDGKSGLCGHVDITIAKKVPGGHTDPGHNFPWDAYINLIKETK